MQLITSGRELGRELIRCCNEYGKIAFAVAWATSGTKAYEALLHRRAAIRHGVVGTHFYQTAPEVLEDFVDDERVRFVLQPSGVFHPKIYLFWSGKNWEGFVGSANLTAGALLRNAEVTLHLSSRDTDAQHIKSDLQDIIKGHWATAKKATSHSVSQYRDAHERMKAARESLSGRYGGKETATSPLQSNVMKMAWSQYFETVRDAGEAHLRNRLAVLALARSAFAQSGSLAGMDLETRAAVAGLPNKITELQGYFGSMKGDGVFHGLIKQDAIGISAALDHIPAVGRVERRDYERFVTAFHGAFPDGRKRAGVASRLLSMKRPDTFVCLSAKNRSGLADDFGIAASTIGYDAYWDSVIARVLDSRWWTSPEPSGTEERAVWDGRAAMLDAIFYDD